MRSPDHGEGPGEPHQGEILAGSPRDIAGALERVLPMILGPPRLPAEPGARTGTAHRGPAWSETLDLVREAAEALARGDDRIRQLEAQVADLTRRWDEERRAAQAAMAAAEADRANLAQRLQDERRETEARLQAAEARAEQAEMQSREIALLEQTIRTKNRDLSQRLKEAQARAEQAEARAVEAEHWLRQIHDALKAPLTAMRS